MSIYRKLQEARCRLQGTTLQKTGWNDFSKYYYFELGDFLPTINDIFLEMGMCAVISFTKEMATMKLVDIDDGTSIEFTSPMGSAALKGCHEVQNVGAVETYQRRYLYVVALEIVEHDALDAGGQPPQQQSGTGQAKSHSQEKNQNSPDWTGMVADIAMAKDMGSLQKAFEVAWKASVAAANTNIQSSLTRAKDKRKGELS